MSFSELQPATPGGCAAQESLRRGEDTDRAISGMYKHVLCGVSHAICGSQFNAISFPRGESGEGGFQRRSLLILVHARYINRMTQKSAHKYVSALSMSSCCIVSKRFVSCRIYLKCWPAVRFTG